MSIHNMRESRRRQDWPIFLIIPIIVFLLWIVFRTPPFHWNVSPPATSEELSHFRFTARTGLAGETIWVVQEDYVWKGQWQDMGNTWNDTNSAMHDVQWGIEDMRHESFEATNKVFYVGEPLGSKPNNTKPQ